MPPDQEVTDSLNRQQYDKHKDKEQEEFEQKWHNLADDCPVRYGPRCNLSGEFCGMKNCFGKYWTEHEK